MTRILVFLLALLSAVSWNLWLENREVRQDQHAMLEAYDAFLNTRIKGGVLADKIHENTLAVFRSKQGMVACAVMN